MNWFTRESAAHYPHSVKVAKVQEWGGCEHVVKDPSLLHSISYENDSFGREGHCCCEDCYKLSQAIADDQEKPCSDCGAVFRVGTMTSWVPYDYEPREGDTPLLLCARCSCSHRHLQRVLADNKKRRLEFGDDD